MVNESNASPFCIVGSGYRKHIPKPVKTSFFRRLRSWPILSMAVLMIIVLACVFAPELANCDPKSFYYDA